MTSVIDKTTSNSSIKHLTTRSGHFYFRRKYPVDVQVLAGRKEKKISLGTRNRQIAERLLQKADTEFEVEITKLRAVIAPAVELEAVEINSANTIALCRLFAFQALEADRNERIKGKIKVDEIVQISKMRIARLSELRRCLAVGDVSPIKDELANYLKSQHLDFNGPAALQQEFRFEFMEAHIRVLEAQVFRDAGEVVETPANPSLPWVETEAQKRAGVMNCLAQWRKDNPLNEIKTFESYTRHAIEFREFIGERGFLDISREDILQYRDWLVDVQGNSLLTANNKLGTLVTLSFDVFMDFPISKKPFYRVKFTGINKKSSRQPFSNPELQKIFIHSPVYKDGFRPIGGQEEAVFWVPLIALFTGMRLREICQLRIKDVIQDPVSDSWYFDIQDNGVCQECCSFFLRSPF